MDRDGASLIVHELADDFKTDPSGASGKRLICGVFRRD
jgi:Cu-Zn family superoxide dismutase